MRPTPRDVALLLGLQIGISALAAGIVAVLPFDVGSGGWVCGLGVMIGSQTFAMLKEKRSLAPSPPAIHTASRRWQRSDSWSPRLFAAGVAFQWPDVAALLHVGATWLVLVATLGLALAYGLTRFGFRMGLRNLEAAGRKRAGS